MLGPDNPWFFCPRANPHAAVRLFCIPYAGGSAPIFRSWPDGLPAQVEVFAVQLPGRGGRLKEKPYTRLITLVEDLAHAIQPYLDRPAAIFGHSFGALVSFELARQLRKRSGPLPIHLFLSGYHAPHLADPDPPISSLSDADFVERLRSLNGTPRQVLEEKALMQLLLPTLRADFEALETYLYIPEKPLDCPITVFGGLQDLQLTPDRLEAWRAHTYDSFNIYMLPGDHFFLHTSQALLLSNLSQVLKRQ
jgi:medium-chain acyl-[acyl-carrier-protein] hydrolase